MSNIPFFRLVHDEIPSVTAEAKGNLTLAYENIDQKHKPHTNVIPVFPLFGVETNSTMTRLKKLMDEVIKMEGIRGAKIGVTTRYQFDFGLHSFSVAGEDRERAKYFPPFRETEVEYPAFVITFRNQKDASIFMRRRIANNGTNSYLSVRLNIETELDDGFKALKSHEQFFVGSSFTDQINERYFQGLYGWPKAQYRPDAGSIRIPIRDFMTYSIVVGRMHAATGLDEQARFNFLLRERMALEYGERATLKDTKPNFPAEGAEIIPMFEPPNPSQP